MAPRKKGASKAAVAASASRQYKIGDLVLARVKGFPAWPATVRFKVMLLNLAKLEMCADEYVQKITFDSYDKAAGFSEVAWQSILSSLEVAKENKHQIVQTDHLMKAPLEQKNGLARRIFSKASVDNTSLLEATDKFIQRQPKVIGGAAAGSMLGRDLEELIRRAKDYKKEYGDFFVLVEHLVLGFLQDNHFGKQLFKDFQISKKTLKNAIESIRGHRTVIDQGDSSLLSSVHCV